MKKIALMLLAWSVFYACSNHNNNPNEIPYTKQAPIIDGASEDDCWQKLSWRPIDQNWIGGNYTPQDFTGNYKLCWNEDKLFILAQVTDDTLIDINEEPTYFYWDDDCLEVFIDEDASGGEHQYNHNAFAYHIALDYNVVDMEGPGKFILLNDHIDVKRITQNNISTWELAISIFDDSFQFGQNNTPVRLHDKKQLGFAIAYCDNDTSPHRENFVGSVFVEGDDKNRGYIDANIFNKMTLIK